jgi:hypothetical protein
MPAWLVTSVNSIGPEGLGVVGVGEGDGVAVAVSDEGGAAGDSVFLHPQTKSKTIRKQTIV